MTVTSIEETQVESTRGPHPILMVAYAPMGALTVDRSLLRDNFTVGRNGDNTLTIADSKISGEHLRIKLEGEHFYVEDVGSTNGSFLNGTRLTHSMMLKNHAVIRIGQSVLVFNDDGDELLVPPPVERFGMVGQFHIAPILKAVEEAALSKEHLLITGPSGSGKELCAKAIHSIMSHGGISMPFVAHNAACFSSEDEATSTILGIANRAFTSVNQRAGLIEQAEGGVLFLDEIHNYTTRVQRSLLRIMEDRTYTRIGDTTPRQANVRFILASNASMLNDAIAPDLLGRLRQSLVLPPLSCRRADIPSIFDAVLKQTLKRYQIEENAASQYIKGHHYEQMCLDGFVEYNVRGIRQIADIIATKLATGTPSDETIEQVFSRQFGAIDRETSIPPSPSPTLKTPSPKSKPDKTKRSVYERNKEYIIDVYKDRDGNIAATERALRKRGIKCSRRWLGEYLAKWGIKP